MRALKRFFWIAVVTVADDCGDATFQKVLDAVTHVFEVASAILPFEIAATRSACGEVWEEVGQAFPLVFEHQPEVFAEGAPIVSE